MLVMDGLDATRAIRRTHERNTIPIVGMTALALPENQKACEEAGMSAFLAKPVTKAEPATVLEQHLSNTPNTQLDSDRQPAIDFGVLDRLRAETFDGESDLVPELIEAFLADVPPACEALRVRVAAGDAKAVSADAHRLRSSTSNLGAPRMSVLCKQLELMGISEDLTGAVEAVDELNSEVPRVRAAFEEYLRTSAAGGVSAAAPAA